MNELTVQEIDRQLSTEVRDYVKASKSASTQKALKNDWASFTAWCDKHMRCALPAEPDTIAKYISDMAKTHKVSTIRRHLSTISQAHDTAGIENTTRSSLVRSTMKGISNTHGVAPTQKKAARTDDIKAMVDLCGDGPKGLRDRALILIGFAGGFRRSELVALTTDDLQFTTEGVVITVRKSKTDQEGEGFKKAIHYGRNEDTCPVRSLVAWLDNAKIYERIIFRGVRKGGRVEEVAMSDKAVAMVVKEYAEKAGLNPADYAGHSLRAGLATEAAASGCQDRDIMRMTGHKSVNMVQRYVREANLFRNNVSGSIGL